MEVLSHVPDLAGQTPAFARWMAWQVMRSRSVGLMQCFLPIVVITLLSPRDPHAEHKLRWVLLMQELRDVLKGEKDAPISLVRIDAGPVYDSRPSGERANYL